MLRIPSSIPDGDDNNNGREPIDNYYNNDNHSSNSSNNNNNIDPNATCASQPAISHSHDTRTRMNRRSKPQRMSQSSGHFATTTTSSSSSSSGNAYANAATTTTTTTTLPPNSFATQSTSAGLPRSYTEADGLYRLAGSQDSQIMHSNIDHQSLMDALLSDSDEALEGSLRARTRPRPESQTSSSDSFGRESIELAISSSSSSSSSSDEQQRQEQVLVDDDIVAHAGSETLMELLGAQKDLEQQMHAIEQEELDAYAAAARTENEGLLDVNEEEKEQEIATTADEEEEFAMPSFIRVLYMGATSEKDKRNFMKKLSQAFATLFHYDSPSWLRNPKMFKEKKHHLLLMDLVPPDEDEEDQHGNLIETCEDNGLSIIEADFTWSSPSSSSGEDSNNLTLRIEQYVWLQCESARQYPSDWQQQVPVYARHKFDGFVYPDKAPNGIDLCVYFYDNNHNEHNAKDRLRTEEDMVILWRLKKLGIPIMPILSSGNTATTTTTTTRPRSQPPPQQQHHHYQYARSTVSSSSTASNPSTAMVNTAAAVTTPTIDERRTQFADLLAQYKIKCVDISLSKLDVGLPPSFQRKAKKKRYPSSTTLMTSSITRGSTNNSIIPSGLVQRLGKDWAASSMTTPAPYQILTMDQFAALDRQTVFSILKRSRQKALKREKVLNVIRTKEQCNSDSKYNNTTSDASWIVPSNNNNNNILYPHARIQTRLFARLVLILISIGMILFYFASASRRRQEQVIVPTTNKSWNLTAVIGMSTSQADAQSLSFIVKLGGDNDAEEQQRSTEEKDSGRHYYECVLALPRITTTTSSSHHQVAPTSPLAKLDIQFPYPVNVTHLDFHCPLLNLSEWLDSSSSSLETSDTKPPSPLPASNNGKNKASTTSSSRSRSNSQDRNGNNNNNNNSRSSPKNRSYWERIYHTTNYLFDHQSKILNLMFNGK